MCNIQTPNAPEREREREIERESGRDSSSGVLGKMQPNWRRWAGAYIYIFKSLVIKLKVTLMNLNIFLKEIHSMYILIYTYLHHYEWTDIKYMTTSQTMLIGSFKLASSYGVHYHPHRKKVY